MKVMTNGWLKRREGRVRVKRMRGGLDTMKRLRNEILVRTLSSSILPEQLLLTVSFQLFSWYNVSGKPMTTTVTLEPFARQKRSKRFLLVTENGNGFRLSFTGRQEKQGTSTYVPLNKLCVLAE